MSPPSGPVAHSQVASANGKGKGMSCKGEKGKTKTDMEGKGPSNQKGKPEWVKKGGDPKGWKGKYVGKVGKGKGGEVPAPASTPPADPYLNAFASPCTPFST